MVQKSKGPHISVVNLYFSTVTPKEWDIDNFHDYCREHGSRHFRTLPQINNYWWNTIKNRAESGTDEERKEANRHLKSREKRGRRRARATTGKSSSVTTGAIIGVVNGDVTIGPVGASASVSTGSAPSGIPEAASSEAVPEAVPESSQPESIYSSTSSVVEDTPDDIIVNEIRDGFRPSKLSELLYKNIINVSDPFSIKPFSSTALSTKLNLLPLPLPGRFFDYAIGPFRKYINEDTPEEGRANSNRTSDEKRSFFRLQVEKSPRPDGEAYSPQSHVAHYVHRCMDLILCLSLTWFRGAIREGSMDVTIWGCFIDYLFLAVEDIHIVRKEISLLGSSSYDNTQRDRDRYDGILRYSNGIISFDLALHESSKEPPNLMNDAKGQNDMLKVAKGLAHMLRTMAQLVHYKWEITSQLEVVGFVTSGWNITSYRMSFLSPKVFKLQSDRTRRLDVDAGKLESAFDIMENMAQEKLVVERTLCLVTDYLKTI